MCYFLYLASPLTLSEIRSMLPPGLTVDLCSSSDHQALRSLHRGTATVARILAGRCSCDLVRTRLSNPTDDERHLRERYRGLKVPRAKVIAALDRHRRQETSSPSRPAGSAELTRFVAEHARNAGPSLYYLSFDPDSGPLSVPFGLEPIAAPAAAMTSGGWLRESTPILITR